MSKAERVKITRKVKQNAHLLTAPKARSRRDGVDSMKVSKKRSSEGWSMLHNITCTTFVQYTHSVHILSRSRRKHKRGLGADHHEKRQSHSKSWKKTLVCHSHALVHSHRYKQCILLCRYLLRTREIPIFIFSLDHPLPGEDVSSGAL